MPITGGDVAGIIACTGLFGWIPVMVWWKHRLRLEELRSKQITAQSEDTLIALRQVQRELRELRETTTHFDLSFDAGMSRLEERVASIEKEAAPMEAAYTPSTTAYRAESPQVLVAGRER